MSTQPNTPSEADRRTANEIIMAPRNQEHAAKLIAEHVAGAVAASHRCPIGLDDNHGICSAGTCDVCREAHLAGAIGACAAAYEAWRISITDMGEQLTQAREGRATAQAEVAAKDAEIERLKGICRRFEASVAAGMTPDEAARVRSVVDRQREALELAAAQNQMCLEHFREADMAAWARGCMDVRAAITATLALTADSAAKEGKTP